MITQSFNLNLIPDSAPVVVHVDQYDVGEGRFVIKLMNGDTPYTPVGATAVIQGMKPDGHGFIYAATISGNTVTADLVEQMSIVAGNVRCQLVITDADDRTGTFVFIIAVQKSALPADSDMSTSDYQLVENLIITAESINTNPPKIGTNGNWWIWDVPTMAYVDSGVDASITVDIENITMLSPDMEPYVTNTGTATDPVFHLFIPRGQTGATGPAAGFGTPTASVDANVGTPSVSISASGPDTAKVFDFQFHNMKGATGDTGATGAAAGFGTPTASVDANTGTPSVSVSASGPDTAKVFDFQFHNLKGADGTNTDPNAVHWTDNTKIGGKNYVTYNNPGGNNIFSVDDKGIATANGGQSSRVWFMYSDGGIFLPKGRYIINGLPSQGSNTTFNFFYRKHGQTSGTDVYNNETIIDVTEDTRYDLYITLFANYTASDLVFKPMIRSELDPDPTFEPSSLPNSELTKNLFMNNRYKYTYTDSDNNSVDFIFRKRSDFVTVSASSGTQIKFSTSWVHPNDAVLPEELRPLVSGNYANMVVFGGNAVLIKIETNGNIYFASNTSSAIWAQGTGIFDITK